jgi:ABC-type multidrug transport system permease subunit
MQKNKTNTPNNPYAALAAAIVGPFVGVVALFAIFTPSNIGYLVGIAIAFSILEIFLGFNASKKKK